MLESVNGTTLWTCSCGGGLFSPDGSVLFTNNYTGSFITNMSPPVLALDARTGRTLWTMSNLTLLDVLESPSCVVMQTVSPNSTSVVAVEATSGRVLWTVPGLAPYVAYPNRLATFVQVTGTEYVIVASGAIVVCVASSTGAVAWRVDLGSWLVVAVDLGLLDPSTGSVPVFISASLYVLAYATPARTTGLPQVLSS